MNYIYVYTDETTFYDLVVTSVYIINKFESQSQPFQFAIDSFRFAFRMGTCKLFHDENKTYVIRMKKSHPCKPEGINTVIYFTQ